MAERIPLLPEYRKSPFEGYAIKYLERNFWKFQKTIGEWEDAVSEAAYCYYWTRQYYGGRIKNQKHFMALFKRCLYSWFVDWANWDTKVTITESTYAEKQPEVTTGFEGDLLVKLGEASTELREVLGIILNSPAEILVTFKEDVKKGIDVFFKNVVVYCGLPESKAASLESELRIILE